MRRIRGTVDDCFVGFLGFLLVVCALTAWAMGSTTAQARVDGFRTGTRFIVPDVPGTDPDAVCRVCGAWYFGDYAHVWGVSHLAKIHPGKP